MTFSQKLIALRRRDGLTQTALAREVGVTRQAVYLWEKGTSYPEAEALLSLRRLFGVTIDELLVDGISLPGAAAKEGERRPETAPRPRQIEPSSVVEETAEPDGSEADFPRFDENSEQTPDKKEKIDDRQPEKGNPSAPIAASEPERNGAPLRAKIEPSKKLKSGSILDLVGAFFRKKK